MIFPLLSVEENLRTGLPARSDGSRDIPDQVFDIFPVLRTMLKRRGGDLSGGQQQQLAIARALVTDPQVLLLDEPTEGIQPNIVHEIGDIIRTLNEELKLTVLLVEQKLPFVQRICDHFCIMDKGRVVAGGEIGALDQSPRVEIFNGMMDLRGSWSGRYAGRLPLTWLALLAAVSVANAEPLEVLVTLRGLDQFPPQDELAPALESAMVEAVGESVQVQFCPHELDQGCEARGSGRHLQIEVRPPIQAESGRGITVGVSANPRSLDYGKVTKLPVGCDLTENDQTQTQTEVELQVSRSRLNEPRYLAGQLVDACGKLLAPQSASTPGLAQSAANEPAPAPQGPATMQVELDGSKASVRTSIGGDQR